MTVSQHPAQPTDPRTVSELAEAVHAGLPTTIADLSSLVRIPSVSWEAFDPSHVAASADAVARLVEETGLFDEVRVSRAPIGSTGLTGQPAVLARREARDGKKTVLLYAHHDVQPQGDDADWDTPPFEPTLKGERLYGRGASDDKAGVMTHVAALRAVRDVIGDDLGVGVALFIEGEEEFGSRSFADFLAQHRDELEADVIVVADSDNWSTTVPAITVGLRGNVTFRLTVRTLSHASHSGMLGGAVPDAMLAMVKLLATLHDDEGSVAVPGLLSRDADHPEQTEEKLREESGLLEGVRPIGRGPLLSRVWSQPSLTVTGIDAPSVANASNTLAPEVSVRISARIAPGQTADSAFEAIEAHLRAAAPFGAHLAIDDVDKGDPFLVDASGPAIADVTVAMTEAWGTAPVQTGIGGSIPFIADLVKTFPEAEILVTGVEDPDTRAHSPNESQHLGVLQRAILSEAILIARLDAGR
ncbi:dipeptidase [Frigoribacterium faeni]|uniref:Acetylornithine deacetylase/succinyl-diaminopimelate desuccinylase-like protein n=1 Tax=Frigoribacterium faeni TaxID=145483 RepID=A0A7W3PI32_9MICO|nr:dipeptidase [Frigoribacterium faeni]MBA8812985.1 acetylornithine deacetylase/succinyl-diaminopimelate desuccinylase-like protein [Frigoribacterium faeni]GEK82024.1 dipeptidase [Frigoribacterium faeni]